MARSIEKAGKGKTVAEGNTRFNALPAGEYSVSVYDVEEGTYNKGGANEGRDNYRVQLRIADGQVGANRRLFETVGLFREWAPTAKNPEGSDNFTFFGFFAAVAGVREKDFRKAVEVWISDPKTETEKIEKALTAIANEDFRAEVAEQAGEGLQVPDPSELMGKKVNVVLKVELDDYAYKKAVKEWEEDGNDSDFPESPEDFTTNRVSSWKVYKEVTQGDVQEPEERFTL